MFDTRIPSRTDLISIHIAFVWRTTALLAALSACGETRAPGIADSSAAPTGPLAETPRLVATDSVVLAESDSIAVGLPSSFVVGAKGDFYVSDAGLSQVVHFDRAGRPLGMVGRKGSGPGEYKAPTWLTLLGDSVLLVKNDARLRVMAYSADSGRFLWDRVFPAQTSSMFVGGDNIYVGLIDAARGGSIGVLGAGSASSELPARDSVRVVGPLPELFTRVPQASSVFGSVEVTAFGDTIASYEVSDHLYLTRDDGSRGAVIDSIEVPRVSRRGARLDLFRQVTNDRESAMAAFLQSSIPFELARLSSGLVALIAFDPTMAERRITGRLYLSVIDLPRRRVCADALIPGQTDPPARATFRGDTLFVLSQEVTASERARTIVRSYRIDVGGCRWR